MTPLPSTDTQREKILIWLPSPMGDAILATPALRAIREHFKNAEITYLSSSLVRDVLSPCRFNDNWIETNSKNILKTANQLQKHNFTHAILLKNSFGSAFATFWAKIKSRIGYSREARGTFLTEKLYPPKTSNGKYKPQPMIDYYLAIASWLGAEITDRRLEINVTEQDKTELRAKMPQLFEKNAPLIVLVPGGAFGPSKCWPAERFAKTADRLIQNHNAKIVVSVAPDKTEKDIAKRICAESKNNLINLGRSPLSIGQLKALFSIASVVICNDTGPRHIAIALGKKVITLYGPNDPVWTLAGFENEAHIIGRAPCAPCLKPHCVKSRHICMESITVERVCRAADRMLKNEKFADVSDHIRQFSQLSENFFIDKEYLADFEQANFTSMDAVFSFNAGQNLTKQNLAKHRQRIKFQLPNNPKIFFLKRYLKPPIEFQLDKWLCNHGPISCGEFEFRAAERLNAAGIGTARVIAYGWQNDLIFKKRSFIITEQISNAASLEQKLPSYFDEPLTKEGLVKRREFVKKLAGFVRSFHWTGYRHRDLYLCHIFCDENENFTLIDLARAFEPILLSEKFRVKDIAQLFYSAAAKYLSRTDRLRFYKTYTRHKEITGKDEAFIEAVLNKAKQMARHDRKHNRIVPYEDIK